MQIVIDIPEEYYNLLKGFDDETCSMDMLLLKHGTPLPKGHGRLIDADAIWDLYHDYEYDFYEAFNDVATIIEADKEGADDADSD